MPTPGSCTRSTLAQSCAPSRTRSGSSRWARTLATTAALVQTGAAESAATTSTPRQSWPTPTSSSPTHICSSSSHRSSQSDSTTTTATVSWIPSASVALGSSPRSARCSWMSLTRWSRLFATSPRSRSRRRRARRWMRPVRRWSSGSQPSRAPQGCESCRTTTSAQRWRASQPGSLPVRSGRATRAARASSRPPRR